MKIIYSAFIGLLLATSCQNDTHPRQAQPQHLESPAKADTGNAPKNADPTVEAFQEFWTRFRTAVMDSDMHAVMEMTQFPFRTRGPYDDNPVIPYNKADFAAVFGSFLKQTAGDELEVIRRTKKISAQDVHTGNYARVGNMVFEKANDEWNLTLVYLAEETIDALAK